MKDVLITIPLTAKKRKKLISIANGHDTKIAPLIRSFIDAFIKDPKKCLDFINQ